LKNPQRKRARTVGEKGYDRDRAGRKTKRRIGRR